MKQNKYCLNNILNIKNKNIKIFTFINKNGIVKLLILTINLKCFENLIRLTNNISWLFIKKK
jgi:hypothetical protein